MPVPKELTILQDWPSITNIILIESIRSINHKEQTTGTLRYYLSSCVDSPAAQIAAVRKHGAIENSLHWVLDVTFREDDARIQDKTAARTFCLLRKISLNIVRGDSGNKDSLRGRRKSAGWDDNYMSHLLFNCRTAT